VAARPLAVNGPVDDLAAELGLTRSDVLVATRWLILVEGSHDQVILEAFFEQELARARAWVVPMRGASQAEFTVRVRDLVTFSEARKRLVLDNIPTSATDLWELAKAHDAEGDRLAARRAMERLGRHLERECKDLAAAGVGALGARRLGRIDVVGLRARDITHYLPVHEFKPEATSWEQLWSQWRSGESHRDFKSWAGITTGRVRDVAYKYRDHVDPDLLRVIDGL
jgi:hypothetical protein